MSDSAPSGARGADPTRHVGVLTHLVRMSPGVISLSGQMYLMITMAVTYQVPTTLRKLREEWTELLPPQPQLPFL